MDLDALAFGAHADDVEITCGGTIIKLAALGRTTGVIALTRGDDPGPITQRSQFDDRPAAGDFDVVGMRPKSQSIQVHGSLLGGKKLIPSS